MKVDQNLNIEVTLVDHEPPKRNPLMDPAWKITGATLHQLGGPFYVAASRDKEEILATFTGIINHYIVFLYTQVETGRHHSIQLIITKKSSWAIHRLVLIPWCQKTF